MEVELGVGELELVGAGGLGELRRVVELKRRLERRLSIELLEDLNWMFPLERTHKKGVVCGGLLYVTTQDPQPPKPSNGARLQAWLYNN